MPPHLLLRWDSHVTALTSGLQQCLAGGELTDLTLSCQGRTLHVHKLVMSVASPLIRSLLNSNPSQHPIIIMRDVSYADMSALLSFVYGGEVTVPEHQLDSFLQTAASLQVRGLADKRQEDERGGVLNGEVPVSSLEPEVVVSESPLADPINNHDSEMTELLDDILSSDVQSVDAEKEVESVDSQSEAGSELEADQHSEGGSERKQDVSGVSEREQDEEGGSKGEQDVVAAVDDVCVDVATRSPSVSGSDVSSVKGVSAVLHKVLETQVNWQERGHYCPYCPREVSLRTLGKHLSHVHAGQIVQCKACCQPVHTGLMAPLIQHGLCVLLMLKQPWLPAADILRHSRQIGRLYKHRPCKSQMLRHYPDLAYFSSSFIFGRVKQKCARCGLVMWSSSMSSHLKKCGDKVDCQYCNKNMARNRLPLHIDIYHAEQRVKDTPAPPLTDSLIAETPPALYHPVFSIDSDDSQQQQSDDTAPGSGQPPLQPASSSAAVVVQCPLCEKTLRQDSIRRHYRVMHAGHAVTDVRALSSRSRPRPVSTDKHASYKGCCCVCGRVMWRKHLRAHVRTAHPGHDPDKVYQAATPAPPVRAVGNPSSPSPVTPTKAKVVRHCPYCWKTMWRCNVKRHIRVMHADQVHRLSAEFDLLAEIRAGARRRGVSPPEYVLNASLAAEEAAVTVDLTEEAADDVGEEGGAAEINTRVAIQEMDDMAEAEGLEARLHVTPSSPEVEKKKVVPAVSRHHEKRLRACPYCLRLVRGCHLKRHIAYWHRGVKRPSAAVAGSTPANQTQHVSSRQRQCPICSKTIVINNLQRHIRAAHPEASADQLATVDPSDGTVGTSAGTADSAEVEEDTGGGECETDQEDDQQQQVVSDSDANSYRRRAPSSSSSSTASSSSASSPCSSPVSETAVRAMLPCAYCDMVVAVGEIDAHVSAEHGSVVDE